MGHFCSSIYLCFLFDLEFFSIMLVVNIFYPAKRKQVAIPRQKRNFSEDYFINGFLPNLLFHTADIFVWK